MRFGSGMADALRGRAAEAATSALTAVVTRGDDRVLERTLGSGPGLRVLFAAMTRRFVPEEAQGFEGEIAYALRTAAGEPRPWTVRIGAADATASPGAAGAPALTVKLTIADFLKIAARDLDPGEALLTGRLDLAGDFVLATRLGAMFGVPASL